MHIAGKKDSPMVMNAVMSAEAQKHSENMATHRTSLGTTVFKAG